MAKWKIGICATVGAAMLAVAFAGIPDSARAEQSAQPKVGIASSLWNDPGYRNWLKEFRQDLQQNLQRLQAEQADGMARTEHGRQTQRQSETRRLDEARQLQAQQQASQSLQAARQRQTCLNACTAPTACGFAVNANPSTSCPAGIALCQSRCR